MFIEKNDYVKITCKNGDILDGKIFAIVLLKDGDKIDAAISLAQQKNSVVEEFGNALVPLSYIKSLKVL